LEIEAVKADDFRQLKPEQSIAEKSEPGANVAHHQIHIFKKLFIFWQDMARSGLQHY